MGELKYGLVLSGGGVRGIAHVGVIKALEEHGIYPAYISGASSGAVVGAFYAAGYKTDEIMKFFLKTSLFSVRNYTVRKAGFLDTIKFYKLFKKYFPEDDFAALEKSLSIVTTNMITGKSKYFHKGPLILPLLASAAFPGVFSPIRIDDDLYADGGIVNNFPTEPLMSDCDKIIGVYAQPLKEVKAKDLKTSFAIMERAYYISRASKAWQKFNDCDLVISPNSLNQYGTFSMNRIEEIYQIGYDSAITELAHFSKQ